MSAATIIEIILSAAIFIAAIAAHVYYRLWQGGFAGKNYMHNEFGIDEEKNKLEENEDESEHNK